MSERQRKTEERGAPPPQPTDKPTLPESYCRPDVWGPPKAMNGTFGGMNQPTAGARFEKTLPKGKHPYQLYSLGTPNGQKVTILLEELGVEYDAWPIKILDQEQFGSEFVALNPNSKIPALYDCTFDPPVRVFESAAILLHLAERAGRFVPTEPRARAECLNWLFWLQGSAPYIGGGFGHFYHYAPIHIEYAIDRFSMETKRILDVLDKHLAGKAWICGDEYTIADMCIYPWARAPGEFYGNAREFLQLDEYKELARWIAAMDARPAVKRGLVVNGFTENAVFERHSATDFEGKV